MSYNLANLQKRLTELSSNKGRKFFSLKVGESAIIRFNDGKEAEPVEVRVHWIEQGSRFFTVPCVAGHPDFPDGCPGCQTGSNPSTRFLWNVIDTRLVHIVKDAQKVRSEPCLAPMGGHCPYCNTSKPEMIGTVYWETSMELANHILSQAQYIRQFCKCGGKLSFDTWQCPSCKAQHEGNVLGNNILFKCPSCGNVVTPDIQYKCDKCGSPTPATLSDAYWKVERTGKTSYSFWITSLEPPHPEHVLPPIELKTALHLEPEDYMRRLGAVNTPPRLGAPMGWNQQPPSSYELPAQRQIPQQVSLQFSNPSNSNPWRGNVYNGNQSAQSLPQTPQSYPASNDPVDDIPF